MPRRREFRVLVTLDLDTSLFRRAFNNVSAYYAALNRHMRSFGFRKSIANRRLPNNTYCTQASEYENDIDIVELVNEIREILDHHNIRCTKIFGCKFRITDYHRRNRQRRQVHGNRR